MITVYSRPSCSQCQLVKEWLNHHHVEFKEVNVDKDQNVIRRLVDAGFTRLPVITDGTSAFSGFDEHDLAQMAKK